MPSKARDYQVWCIPDYHKKTVTLRVRASADTSDWTDFGLLASSEDEAHLMWELFNHEQCSEPLGRIAEVVRGYQYLDKGLYVDFIGRVSELMWGYKDWYRVNSFGIYLNRCENCGLPSFGQPCWSCSYYPNQYSEKGKTWYSLDVFLRKTSAFINPAVWILSKEKATAGYMSGGEFRRGVDWAIKQASEQEWPTFTEVYYNAILQVPQRPIHQEVTND